MVHLSAVKFAGDFGTAVLQIYEDTDGRGVCACGCGVRVACGATEAGSISTVDTKRKFLPYPLL